MKKQKTKIYEDNGRLYFLTFFKFWDDLKPGNYTLEASGPGFCLQRAPEPAIPSRIYGDLAGEAKRYITAFERGDGNMGIILNGEKGSGKTLLSNLICRSLGLPVIRINQRCMGPEFLSFMQQIPSSCVVVIDEFDKMYPEYLSDEGGNNINTQTELLKIMDINSTDKKLFIFTSNELTISRYMVNRPSRIRYKQSFGKLNEEVTDEILQDKLENKAYTEDFMEVCAMFGGLNLDTTLCLIDEINLRDESPKECIKYMNMSMDDAIFTVQLLKDGKTYEYEGRVEFDLTNDPHVPDMHFREEGKDNKTTGKIILRTGYILVSHFHAKISKKGFELVHKDAGYTLRFKRLDYSRQVAYDL